MEAFEVPGPSLLGSGVTFAIAAGSEDEGTRWLDTVTGVGSGVLCAAEAAGGADGLTESGLTTK